MLTPALIIQRKRDGKELTRDEIRGFIKGLSTGDVTDYQATAFLMATFFKGMSLEETVGLTEAMYQSGEHYDLSRIKGPKSDKHSTGGVGDKVSVPLAPQAAASGLKVPMMAGRGLGFSGGTLDKLEAIRGFNVRLPRPQFDKMLTELGCAIIGQSETMVPADRKLYSLRDVTATVDCIPLIVASILSKKLAEGTDSLVLDVKVGSGAFMKTRDQARRLAKALIAVGRKMNLPIRAVLTNMSQPLGYSAGNSLEILESIEVLRNERYLKARETSSADFKELTVQLCAQMLDLAGVTKNLAQARKLAHQKLSDGSAWRLFQEMTRQQGGDVSQIEDPTKLPISRKTVTWTARKRGYIGKMDTEVMGRILVELGGGRKKASDVIDPSVGLLFHRKPGAAVKPSDPIATVYLPEREVPLGELEQQFHAAIEITGTRKPVPKLILEVMG
jgi:pyrimidine-nucleoside phosphorylase